MPWLRKLLPIIAVVMIVAGVVAACGPAPSPSGSPSPTSSPAASVASPTPVATALAVRELTGGTAPLAPGTYTRQAFRPQVVLTIGEGWFAGTVTNGFFDVQQDVGSPDVIAVQFAHVDGVASAAASPLSATTASAAVKAIHQNPTLTVVDESASRMGGLEGLNVIVENRGTGPAPVLEVSAGTLSIDPGRKLWISFFDTPDGLLAVLVGGSIAQWERTLTVAEPVLESVLIGSPGA